MAFGVCINSKDLYATFHAYAFNVFKDDLSQAHPPRWYYQWQEVKKYDFVFGSMYGTTSSAAMYGRAHNVFFAGRATGAVIEISIVLKIDGSSVGLIEVVRSLTGGHVGCLTSCGGRKLTSSLRRLAVLRLRTFLNMFF